MRVNTSDVLLGVLFFLVAALFIYTVSSRCRCGRENFVDQKYPNLADISKEECSRVFGSEENGKAMRDAILADGRMAQYKDRCNSKFPGQFERLRGPVA